MQRWRRPLQRGRALVLYPLVGFMAILVALMPITNLADGSWGGVIATPFGVGLVWLCWRMARSGLYINETGVRVIGLTDSEIVPWSDLRAVSVRAEELVLERTTGHLVASGICRGYQRSPFVIWLHEWRFAELIAVIEDARIR